MIVPVPDGLTATEHRMLVLLRDGQGHVMAELIDLLQDPMSGKESVYAHLSNLRKKLRAHLFTIVTYEQNRNTRYKLLQLDPVS